MKKIVQFKKEFTAYQKKNLRQKIHLILQKLKFKKKITLHTSQHHHRYKSEVHFRKTRGVSRARAVQLP